MKWNDFIKGLEIIGKYLSDEEKENLSMIHAEHDIFYAPLIPIGRISGEDFNTLESLGWFIQEESWCAFV